MPRVVENFGQSLKAALSRKINMVTFANLGSVRLPSLKFVQAFAFGRYGAFSVSAVYLQQFPSYSNHKSKKQQFSRTEAHIFVSPGDAATTITQYVARMERQFNACQTARSMYLSIFNSFRVIRCLSHCISAKIAIFTTFLFLLGMPLGQSR